MPRLLRHGVALLSMVVGSGSVLAGLISMNELTQPPKPEAPEKSARFDVEEREKKKPPERRPEPKRRRAVQSARRAPPPNITTDLSGLSFDLPQFQSADGLGTEKLLSGAGGGDKLVMTEDAVDALPRPRARTAPEYPRKARERGIEGRVVLKLKVSERGVVEQVRVVTSEPPGVFEDVAISAVRQWRFEPARYQGDPVALWVTQPMPFRLN